MNPLISIIIPYYKKKKFFKSTIKSVLKQTHKNFEIILIYDDIDKAELPFIKLTLKKIKNVKIIRSRLVGENHINSIIKPNIGPSINAICFDCANSEIGDYLLSYKKKISIIAHIIENSFNNKKSIQLNIKDLFLSVN